MPFKLKKKEAQIDLIRICRVHVRKSRFSGLFHYFSFSLSSFIPLSLSFYFSFILSLYPFLALHSKYIHFASMSTRLPSK